jgi:rare lipoprotein A (peptidoglycan hydrolase)
VLATVLGMLPGRFCDGRARIAAPLAIAILFAVGTTMLGCAAPSTRQYLPSAPYHSYSSTSSSERVEVASWYGPRLAGRLTSTGETFDPNALTAASKTLPLGSQVRVTNPDNGRSVLVRINDRGPFVRGRSLDLSRRAAQQIALTGKGVGRVRIAAVDAPSDGAARDAQAPLRRSAFTYASNTMRRSHCIPRAAYHRRPRRSLRRMIESNPAGAWLVSAMHL